MIERPRVATYVWATGGRDDERFIKDARTRLRIRQGVARIILAGVQPPEDLTVLSAHLELVATEDWPGSRTITVQRVGDREPIRKLTWDNQPGVHPSSSPVSVTQAGSQKRWSFDVTADFVQSMTTGDRIRGWRVTSGEDARRFFHGTQARRTAQRPRVVLVVTKKPAAPTDLSPSHGAVATAKPVVRWSTPQSGFTHVQVQVDVNDGSFTAPLWTSPELSVTTPVVDLATTNFPGLANGDDRDWRVRVKNDAGWSAWSLPGRLWRQDKPTVTITNPGSVTGDGTPPIAWTLSAGSTQEQWRAFLRDAAGRALWDSGWTPGTLQTVSPQRGLRTDGDSGFVEVRVRDNVDREPGGGERDYSSASRAFTLDLDVAAGGAVTWVNGQAHPTAPWVDLTWGRNEPPDEWRIVADGVILDERPGPDLVSGTARFTWRDWTARAHHTRTYLVQAIVNGVVSTSQPVPVTPGIRGVWLGDPTEVRDVLIVGRDEITAENTELATVVYPIGGSAPISVRQGRYGLSGAVTGLLTNAFGRLGADEAEVLLDMADTPARVFRLAWADQNIPVTLRNIQAPPRRVGTHPGRVTRTVALEFTEEPDR